MLITFSCSAYSDITMFGDVAIRFLKMMGHSGTVPGAILAEDVQKALDHFQEALQAAKAQSESDASYDKENGEPLVSLAHRAMPLIELLKAAAKEECNVMWDK